jgi:hypothetical protein
VRAPVISWAIKGKIFEHVCSVVAARLLSPGQTMHKTKCKQVLGARIKGTRARMLSYRTNHKSVQHQTTVTFFLTVCTYELRCVSIFQLIKINDIFVTKKLKNIHLY